MLLTLNLRVRLQDFYYCIQLLLHAEETQTQAAIGRGGNRESQRELGYSTQLCIGN